MQSLIGKKALVTGGGTGIGRAIALDLSEAGATVTVCGRRKEPLEETVNLAAGKPGPMDAMVCDLMEPDAIEELAQALIQRQQGVDILINNAGFSSKVRNPLYISAEEWRQVMDVNTLGPAMLTRALLGPMMDRGDGHVLMISSMAAIRPGPLSGVAYSSAKSASRAYMETISSQIRGNGIRCTSIFPGEVDTPILDNRPLVPNSEVRALMMQPEDISAAVMMSVLLPKRANVSEIAITATVPRNMTADVKASLERKE
jgi:NADP-dependent 3-hydroxy acid dehydrogenase YdfG